MRNLFWNYLRARSLSVGRFLANKKYWLLVLLCAYGLADLIIISLRPVFLLKEAPRPISSYSFQKKNHSEESQYMPIWDLNIFHDEGLPIENIAKNDIPQKSRLPLRLNGVIVYREPKLSIASITLKNQNKSGAYRVEEEITTTDRLSKVKKILARVTKITSKRVYFINFANNKNEYIELSLSRSMAFDSDLKSKKKIDKNSGFFKKTGNFQFQISRSDINKHLRNIDSILRDAKVVPHRVNGKLIGWRFKYIKKGSIYEQFGFQESDILTSVSGELPRSQLHAAELFHKFSDSVSKLDIIVKRKGKDIPFSWNVDEDVAKEKPPESRFLYY